MIRKLSLRLLGLVAFAASAGAAEATVVYSDTVLARGPEFATAIELGANGPGLYRVTATDLHWLGAPLAALSFGAFTATAPIKTLAGAGTLEFFHSGESKTYLQLYARPAAGKSAGLIALTVDVAVVALPASLWLLLSALGAAWFYRWLERRAAALSASPWDDVPVATASPAAVSNEGAARPVRAARRAGTRRLAAGAAVPGAAAASAA
jgi:hypothetical protein